MKFTISSTVKACSIAFLFIFCSEIYGAPSYVVTFAGKITDVAMPPRPFAVSPPNGFTTLLIGDAFTLKIEIDTGFIPDGQTTSQLAYANFHAKWSLEAGDYSLAFDGGFLLSAQNNFLGQDLDSLEFKNAQNLVLGGSVWPQFSLDVQLISGKNWFRRSDDGILGLEDVLNGTYSTLGEKNQLNWDFLGAIAHQNNGFFLGQIDRVSFTPLSAVPEPSTYAVFSSLVLLVGVFVRSKNRKTYV